MNTRSRIALLTVMLPLSLQAQYALERDYNLLRDGDCLEKIQIPYTEPGEKGENVIWHYDHSLSDSKGYRQTYRIANDSLLCIEHDTEYDYCMKGDTLFLRNVENRTTRIRYEEPRIVQKFPFQYGDSIGGEYAGTGIYGEKLHFRLVGTNYIVADGWGRLSNGEDTLEHVLRIHQHAEFLQWSSMDSIPEGKIPPADCKVSRMIEERYLWYRIGSRYPIMESIESRSFSEGKERLHFSTSFLYLPGLQTFGLGKDLKNEKRLEKHSKSHPKKSPLHEDGMPISDITARLGHDGKSLETSYKLHTDAPLSFQAYDNVSRLLASAFYPNRTSGIYNERLEFTTSPIGNVILLYVSIGGKQQSIKVQIR